VTNRAGQAVPIAQVAHLELSPSPAKLRHYDKQRCLTVTAETDNGFNTDRVTKQVLAELANVQLPASVRLVPAGEIESRQESFGGIGMALLVAAFGVLSILVLEFRTFKSTLIVASVIPLGVIGGLLALYLSGNTLSFTATIGFCCAHGYRSQKFHLAGRLHQPVARPRHGARVTRSRPPVRPASCPFC